MEPTQLCIIWVNADKEAAMNMAFMYGKNALIKGWWAESRLIIWGPSQKLLLADPQLQQEIMAMQDAGVEIWACRACSDGYHITEKLEKMGLDVLHVGEPLSAMMKRNWKVLTI